jgi:hypothetical protein
MPLKPNSRQLTRERILAYGNMGSGKSHGWAALRKWYEVTDTPGHFYIISTEWEMALRTAEAYLDGTPGNNFFSNATIKEAWDFTTLLDVCKEMGTKTVDGDWLVIDSISNFWLWTQDEYAVQHFGFETMAEARAERGNLEVNWQKVNADYRSLVLPLITRNPAHVYACAQGDTVTNDGKWKDSKEITEMFGRYGMKPVGQKQLGYQFHTVLLMKADGKDSWAYTTVDDPSRDKKVSEPVLDFVMSYLMPVAGWEMTE